MKVCWKRSVVYSVEANLHTCRVKLELHTQKKNQVHERLKGVIARKQRKTERQRV